ncbi:hypothetical protein BD770DRAFT_470867, partial [Pilaira anomala]
MLPVIVMTGVLAMTGVAMTNSGACFSCCCYDEILLFVVCWHLKAKGQNGC